MGRRSSLLLLFPISLILLWAFSSSSSLSSLSSGEPPKWPASQPPHSRRPGADSDAPDEHVGAEVHGKGYWDWIEKEYDHLITWKPGVGRVPECKRTLLFVFTSVHGFASEYLLLVRLLLLASHPRYNYTVLISSLKPWNYGPFESYFLDVNDPAFLGCRPHHGWDSRLMRKKIGARDPENPLDDWWKERDHVIWDRTGGVEYIDALIASLYVDPVKLEALHQNDTLQASAIESGGLLEGLTWRETIPEAFEDVFKEMSRVARKYWRVNGEVLKLVNEVEGRVFDGKEEEETNLVGVHVRLGDKFREANHMGPSNLNPLLSNNESHNPHAYTLDSLDHLDANDIRTRVYVKSSEAVVSTSPKMERTEKKTLVIMSDDVSAVDVLEEWGDENGWKVVGTEKDEADEEPKGEKEGEEEEEEEVWDEKKRRATSNKIKRGKPLRIINNRTPEPAPTPARETDATQPSSEQTAALNGFSETSFNSLPESERINLGLKFVRDVTFLAEKTDGVVFTGSSNVGRLLVLLWKGGWEGVQRGGVRSVDVRWFPTARFI
ncbi:hypothetical protein BT69DRAFT_1351621 [Atractiella rhizophila]|nr:hypothetical protein BT69DRAFT_1351621 [Atractiella rhizophila]